MVTDSYFGNERAGVSMMDPVKMAKMGAVLPPHYAQMTSNLAKLEDSYSQGTPTQVDKQLYGMGGYHERDYLAAPYALQDANNGMNSNPEAYPSDHLSRKYLQTGQKTVGSRNALEEVLNARQFQMYEGPQQFNTGTVIDLTQQVQTGLGAPVVTQQHYGTSSMVPHSMRNAGIQEIIASQPNATMPIRSAIIGQQVAFASGISTLIQRSTIETMIDSDGSYRKLETFYERAEQQTRLSTSTSLGK